jgi:hypothetical protein
MGGEKGRRLRTHAAGRGTPVVTARVGPFDSQLVELAQRIGQPAWLVAVIVDEEERAGRVVRARDGTLALDPAPAVARASRGAETPRRVGLNAAAS